MLGAARHRDEAMEDLQALHDRLDALCERAARRGDDAAVMAEMNDLLSEGYARALLAEARLIALEERLTDRIADLSAGRVEEVRLLAGEHRAAERAVTRLRARLADVHERFLALGGVPHCV
jgi:hypothetical protein